MFDGTPIWRFFNRALACYRFGDCTDNLAPAAATLLAQIAMDVHATHGSPIHLYTGFRKATAGVNV